MIDKLKYVTINGAKYPMAFTLIVMEHVQEQYGSMDEWTKALEPTEKIVDEETGKVLRDKKTGKALVRSLEPKFKDVIWTFQEFINEGIDIENEKTGENKPLLTHKQVGRLITNINEIGSLLRNMTTESTVDEDEIKDGESPNAPTTQNQASQ